MDKTQDPLPKREIIDNVCAKFVELIGAATSVNDIRACKLFFNQELEAILARNEQN